MKRIKYLVCMGLLLMIAFVGSRYSVQYTLDNLPLHGRITLQDTEDNQIEIESIILHHNSWANDPYADFYFDPEIWQEKYTIKYKNNVKLIIYTNQEEDHKDYASLDHQNVLAALKVKCFFTKETRYIRLSQDFYDNLAALKWQSYTN